MQKYCFQIKALTTTGEWVLIYEEISEANLSQEEMQNGVDQLRELVSNAYDNKTGASFKAGDSIVINIQAFAGFDIKVTRV